MKEIKKKLDSIQSILWVMVWFLMMLFFAVVLFGYKIVHG